jgi:hypothetical protein
MDTDLAIWAVLLLIAKHQKQPNITGRRKVTCEKNQVEYDTAMKMHELQLHANSKNEPREHSVA